MATAIPVSMASQSRPGRRRLPSADRRAQLVATAGDLFITCGFEAVSMADIAEAISVSRPTVYSYFPSTLEILDALLKELMADLPAQLAPHLRELDAARPFSELLRYLIANPRLMLLLQSGGGPTFKARRRVFMENLTAQLPQTQEAAERSPQALCFVMTLLEGVAYRAATTPPADLDQLAEALDTFLLGGIGAIREQRS